MEAVTSLGMRPGRNQRQSSCHLLPGPPRSCCTEARGQQAKWWCVDWYKWQFAALTGQATSCMDAQAPLPPALPCIWPHVQEVRGVGAAAHTVVAGAKGAANEQRQLGHLGLCSRGRDAFGQVGAIAIGVSPAWLPAPKEPPVRSVSLGTCFRGRSRVLVCAC